MTAGPPTCSRSLSATRRSGTTSKFPAGEVVAVCRDYRLDLTESDFLQSEGNVTLTDQGREKWERFVRKTVAAHVRGADGDPLTDRELDRAAALLLPGNPHAGEPDAAAVWERAVTERPGGQEGP